MEPAQLVREARHAPDNASSEKDWLSWRLFLLMLAAAIFAAFPKIVLGLDTFFYRDFGSICYPQAFYQAQSLLRGELPLWNPYNYCGSPFMAQWGTWYPVWFLHGLLPMPWSVNFLHLVHLIWAGCGMYWLVRRWGGGSCAAAFAGFGYVFNGVTLSCLMWPGYTAFLSWSPWALGCTMAAWKYGGRWLVLAALASAMQVLACAPELTVLFWVLVGILWTMDVVRHEAPAWASFGRLVLVVGLAAGITMVQMLPFFDLLLHSQRDRTFGDNKWVMPLWGWANLLVPLFHCYKSAHGPWFQSGQELVGSYYLGTGVLALALTGALLKRNGRMMVLGAMMLFCWAMALGPDGFLFDLVKRIFPWIGIMRYPVKFALFPVFLVPLLGAAALDEDEPASIGARKRLLVGIGALILLIMAAILCFAAKYPLPNDQWRPAALNAIWRAVLATVLIAGVVLVGSQKKGVTRTVIQLLLLLVLPIDAMTHSPQIMPHIPAANFDPGIWKVCVKEPPPELGKGRVMTSPEADRFMRSSGVSDMALDFTGRRIAERHSLNLLDKVPKVAGGGMILRPAYFDRLETYLYKNPKIHYGSGLLDFLSVVWISSPDSLLGWSKRGNYLPLLSAGQRPLFASDDEILHELTTDQFDPREIVYLPESARGLVSLPTKRSNARVLSAQMTANSVEAEVEAAEPTLVVISQSYYHLWRAYVDGRATPLLRANLAFQALQVSAGKHQVALVYSDHFLKLGMAVSLITLGICAVMWWLMRKH